MVFHMARRQAGDNAFREGLRALAREKLFRAASWDDFDRAIFRGSKADASSFFRPWVDRPGAPALALKDAKTERLPGRWKVTGKLVQGKPYYELRVPIRVETDGKAVDAVIATDRGEIPLVLLAFSRPRTRRASVKGASGAARRVSACRLRCRTPAGNHERLVYP
jgi:aminopeptidase N